MLRFSAVTLPPVIKSVPEKLKDPSCTTLLTLSSVSSGLLEGSFSLTLTAFLKGGSVTAENLTIEGTFIAVPGDIPSIS